MMLTRLNPWTSLPGIQRGMFQQAIQRVAQGRKAVAADG